MFARRLMLILAAMVSAGSVAAESSSADSCAEQQKEGVRTIAGIRSRYDQMLAEQRKRVEDGAKKIKDETPDATGPDATVNLDIQLRDNIREIKLDLPEVTMRQEKMSMDLPQTTMKTQTWSWDVPEI